MASVVTCALHTASHSIYLPASWLWAVGPPTTMLVQWAGAQRSSAVGVVGLCLWVKGAGMQVTCCQVVSALGYLMLCLGNDLNTMCEPKRACGYWLQVLALGASLACHIGWGGPSCGHL